MSVTLRALYFSLGAAICCLIAYSFWSWSWPSLTRPYSATAAPKWAVSDTKSGDAVTARIWTVSGRVYENSDVNVEILFENHSAEQINDLRILDFQAPGFKESPDARECWERRHPVCTGGPGDDQRVHSPGPYRLAPGGSIRLWGKLIPAESSGRFGILALYGWSQQQKGAKLKKDLRVFHSGAASLQPIEVTSPAREAAGTSIRLLQSLALPIVVAILAWWFQRIQQDRSERSEIWKEQLERLFVFIQSHYLSISRNILLLDKHHSQGAPQDRLLYHFLMIIWGVRKLRDRRGGWFFSTKEGESVVGAGWKLFSSHVQTHFDDAAIENALDLLVKEKAATLPKFWALVVPNGALRQLETEFLAWVNGTRNPPDQGKSFNECVAILKVVGTVMRYEWDRPFFRHWYGRPSVFDRQAYIGELKKLSSVQAADMDNLVRVAMDYSPAWRVHMKAGVADFISDPLQKYKKNRLKRDIGR